MRKLLCVAAGLMFLTSLVVAADNPKTLTNNQLDAITAGDAPASGAIVVNNSTADIQKSGSVEIKDGAESNVKAVNLFNSVSSQIAAGTNIFNGNKSTTTFNDVDQDNRIHQTMGSGAELNNYQRGLEVFAKNLDVDLKVQHTPVGLYLDVDADRLAVLGPVKFDEAEAQYIVADGSKLKAEEDYQVEIGANAEDMVSAVNIVNAANSQIGLGLNLSTLSQATTTFHNISQSNSIVQH
jgi:hypothetical protein